MSNQQLVRTAATRRAHRTGPGDCSARATGGDRAQPGANGARPRGGLGWISLRRQARPGWPMHGAARQGMELAGPP